jgi:hypothetical protein
MLVKLEILQYVFYKYKTNLEYMYMYYEDGNGYYIFYEIQWNYFNEG